MEGAYSGLPTPCFVVDTALLEKNLKVLHGITERTGCKILLAQKAFSMFSLYPLIGQYLSGATASGLYEARLGAEMGKENHVFCTAYKRQDFPEITRLCKHITFNSFTQLETFAPLALEAGCSIGIRVNPQCSTQQGHELYDPCAPGSRLGVIKSEFCPEMIDKFGIQGIHLHTLCQQDAEPLETTVQALEAQFGAYLSGLKWINLGGGHHITRPGYHISLLEQIVIRLRDKYQVQVYLEPGEAVALNAGFLVTEVLDIVKNAEYQIAILDSSAACHMPDVIEMPYRPPLMESGEPQQYTHTYRLAGPSCLAGDVIGDYSFREPLKIGSRLIFEDMAIYSMVKTNTFNGIPLPAIAIQNAQECRVVKSFGYEDFKGRLS